MSILIRSSFPAFALVAMISAAQAQTAPAQDHDAHHPTDTAAAPASPAPAPMPMMGQMMGGSGGMMPMMGRMMGSAGMMPFEHVEGRIAFLKAELKITDAQAPQWNAFAGALRASAKAHQSMHDGMMGGGMPSSWPERLALHQKALSARLESLKALEAAGRPLYSVLSAEQKALADRLLSGPMGMM